MTWPRFQFTILNLLWATFWVAVAMAIWSIPNRIYWLEGPGRFFHTSAVSTSVSFLCAVIAIGALLGQQRRVILVALVCFLVVGGLLLSPLASAKFHRQYPIIGR